MSAARASVVPALRRRRRIVAAIGAATLTGAMVLAGCAAPVPDRDDLLSSFEITGMSTTEATCLADAITATLTTDEIEQLAERGGGGAPYDDPNQVGDTADKLRDAMNVCRDAAAASGESTTAPPTTPTTVATTVPATAPASVTTDGASLDTTPDATSVPADGSGGSSSTSVAG